MLTDDHNILNIDDISNFSVDENNTGNQIIIKAIGVGGGGNNAVDHMFRENIRDVAFVNINTDLQALRRSPVPERLVIGNGLGAGADPEVARVAAEEAADRISELFDDSTQMVFITAGMGGGTGTGAAPVVARLAKERGLLTVGIVTIPFLFEGQRKILKALAGADEMSKYVDALLVINNERLTEIYPDLDIVNGFAKADDTLTTAARSISEIITCEGKINLDFKDVNTTLRNGGSAIISSGYGEGSGRVTKAIEDALNSPLLKNRDIMGSKRLLFNLGFNPKAEEKFLMEEARELTTFVTSIDSEVDVIWGMNFDESLGNKVKITILAAGFDVSLDQEEKEIRENSKPKNDIFGTLGFGRTQNGNGDRGRRQTANTQAAGETPDQMRKRIAEEYGDKVDQFQSGKDRSRYIVLTPDQMDDDAVIEILEKTPTATRDKKTVEKVKELAGTLRRVERTDEGDRHNNGKAISFV